MVVFVVFSFFTLSSSAWWDDLLFWMERDGYCTTVEWGLERVVRESEGVMFEPFQEALGFQLGITRGAKGEFWRRILLRSIGIEHSVIGIT